jgi:APA family basic amino acid/polyamine antiporter
MFGIFEKKTVEEVLAVKEGKQLERSLGLISLIFIGIGAIIGAGIFIASGLAAAIAGPSVIISFIIGAVICGFISFCYAELTSIVTVSGGIYAYAQITLGKLGAWLAGWINICMYVLVSAVVAIGWSQYFIGMLKTFGIILPSFGPINLVAVLIILGLTALLAKGNKGGTLLNNAIVILNIAIILIFGVIGGFYVDVANYIPFAPLGLTGIFVGTAMVFFAFTGFDAVASAAEEAINPKRNLPIGIIVSLLISSVLYILVAVVLTGLTSYTGFIGQEVPIQFAMLQAGLGWLMNIVTVGVLAGLTTTLLVALYVSPRTIFAMSRDGLLPDFFGKLNKSSVPYISVIIVGLISAFIAGIAPIAAVFEVVNVITLGVFILVGVMTILLRRQRPDLEIPFPVPLYPWIPLAAIFGCLGLATQLSLFSLGLFGGWILLGIIVFLIYQWIKARR